MKEFTLTHQPIGNEQPYCQQTIERVPRNPVEGKPVAIYAMAEPTDAAERVVLQWSTDNWDTSHFEDAACLGNSDSVGNRGEARIWCALIPAQKSDTTVLYKLIADSGRDRLETDIFSYEVKNCTTLTGPVECRMDDGHAVISYINSDEKSLVLSADGNGCIHLTVSDGPWDSKGLSAITLEDQDESSVRLTAAEVAIKLNKKTGAITWRDSRRNASIAFTGRLDVIGGGGDSSPMETELFFHALTDEGFYGLGERYNALNQRGQVIHNRVFEQYTNQKLKTYLPVPLLYSTRNSGIFTETERNIRYDLCSLNESMWSMRAEHAPGENLEMELFFGEPAKIIRDFTDLTGKPAGLPDWAFGLWMSANEWNTQERVEEIASETLKLDIPGTVLVIEAWSDETTFYIWNGAEYSPKEPGAVPQLSDFDFSQSKHWQDPKGMIDKLHAQGIKVVLWQIPVMKATEDSNPQHDIDQKHFETANLCARESDGSPYKVRPGWFRNSMLPDFTKQETIEWWASRREYLLTEMGVDGFKTDGGEHLWGEDVIFSDGRTGGEMINAYPALYIKSYADFVRKHKGDEGLLFSRSGYTGVQTSPCHWAGDQDSTWEAYRSGFRAMMNSGLSGIPFMGWDLGGFSGEIPTAELYLRSAAASVFCPIMQYHAENFGWQSPCRDRTPWNIAERWDRPDVIEVFRAWAKLRESLIPYISSEAAWCRESGEPLMRPMIIDFWNDKEARNREDQYLFGRSLLTAPLFHEGTSEREVYLPEGLWTDAWSGEEITGPAMRMCKAGLDSIPLFIRGGKSAGLTPDFFKAVE